MATAITRTAVILAGSGDWDDWIEVIRTAAEGASVWKNVDPSKDVFEDLVEPTLLTPNDISPSTTANTITKFSQLSADEKEEYRFQQDVYKRKLQIYDRQVAGIQSLRTRIQETVTRDNLTYTFDCATPWHMLRNLRKRFAPTEESKERELQRRYSSLKEKVKDLPEVEIWLAQWEKVYTDGVKANLPEVQGTRTLRDFLAVVATFSSGFSDYWQNRLIDADATKPDFYELVQKYREWRADNTLRDSRNRFQNHTYPVGPRLNGKNEDGKSVCLCGEDHKYAECLYLIEQLRPHGWLETSADPVIVRKIEDILSRSEKVKNIVEDLRAKARLSGGQGSGGARRTPAGMGVSQGNIVV